MIGLAILLLILLLAGICLYRAWALKPTPAATAPVPLNNGPEDARYGARLAQMIRCDTISSRDNPNLEKFRAFHQTLEELFPQVHARCERHDFNGSLLYKWAGKGTADPIILMSHQDVVEAGGKWEHAPFSGHIDGEGRIWGRGTVDTKGSLFCIFSALEELIAAGYEPEGDVYIASSCTEEISGTGAPDTVAWLKRNGVKPSLVMDEGGVILQAPIAGVSGTYAMVGVVEKGYADVKFIARSNGGHASAPGRDTPLVRLGKFMVDVENHSPFRSELSPTMVEMFRRLSPNMIFPMKLVMANLWLFRPLLVRVLPLISPAVGAMMHTTIAFTTARGSDGLNVLPQQAYVTGNMRLIHHQPGKESLTAISSMANKYNIQTEVLYQDEPCPVVGYESDQFRLVEEICGKIYPGVQVSPYVMTGGTDARFYKEICPNCIRFAPLYINQQQYGSIHGLDENLHQGTLAPAIAFYKQIIQNAHRIHA